MTGWVNVLAATTSQRIGAGVVIAILLGWAVYLALHIGRSEEEPGSEIELAPNRRPYLDDDAMEGPRLDRVLVWSAVLVAICAIGLPVYWLREPSRQAGAEESFVREAEHRGRVLFQPTDSPEPEGNIGHFGCGGCHGLNGEGGVAPYTLTDYLGRTRSVQWKAPALDTVLRRFSEEEVENIIIYGRPNTPMPAWGIEGGGPMNPQQVTDLVAYIKTLQLSDDEVRDRAVQEIQAEASTLGMAPTDGAALFSAFCARCHTKGWSYGEPEVSAGGAFGPNLRDGATVRQFPVLDDMLEFITTGSEFEKPYGVRGIGSGRMPGFGRMLTREQIRAIVEYERSL